MSAPDATQPQARLTPHGYPQAKRGLGFLANHPQREKVIDAILQGESPASIARWISPTVSRQLIGNLASQVREQKRAAQLVSEVAKIKELALGVTNNLADENGFAKAAVLGARHISRVEQLLAPLERQVAEAEADGDRQGLSSVAKTALTAIRMQAELDGTLAQVAAQFAAPTVQNNLQVVILPGSMPTETVEAPAIKATATPSPETD